MPGSTLLTLILFASTTQVGDDPRIAALKACRNLIGSAERLACFDKATADLAAAVTQGDIAVVSREEANRTRRSLFGFAMPDLPFFKKRGREEEVRELVTRVSNARPIGNGYYRISVEDGGAVWEMTEASASFREPSAGESVTISRGALGSYWLKAGKQREVRVRRIR